MAGREGCVESDLYPNGGLFRQVFVLRFLAGTPRYLSRLHIRTGRRRSPWRLSVTSPPTRQHRCCSCRCHRVGGSVHEGASVTRAGSSDFQGEELRRAHRFVSCAKQSDVMSAGLVCWRRSSVCEVLTWPAATCRRRTGDK